MRRGPLAVGWSRSRGRLVIGLFSVSVLLGGVVGTGAFAPGRHGPSLIAGHRSHVSIPNDGWAYLYASDPSAGLARVDKRPKSLRVARAALAGALALVGLSPFARFRLRPATPGRSSVPARRRAPRAPPMPLPI